MLVYRRVAGSINPNRKYLGTVLGAMYDDLPNRQIKVRTSGG